MTPKTLGKCGQQVNITIRFNIDCVIFKMGIIILASQSVLAVFFCKILCSKPAKHDIEIYRWEGYQRIDMSIGWQISISVISVVYICSTIYLTVRALSCNYRFCYWNEKKSHDNLRLISWLLMPWLLLSPSHQQHGIEYAGYTRPCLSPRRIRWYPAKRALPAMLTHGR